MDDLEQITKVVTMENFVVADFADKWKVAKRNAEVFSIRHWSEAQEQKIRGQGRQPYKFDKTSHIINLLLGTQRAGRSEINFLERRNEDSSRVDVLNSVWKYFSDLYKVPFVESDVFQDGLVNQCGVFEVDIDKSRYYSGDLRVRRVPFDMVLWDTNSRQYDLSDATWMSRRTFYTRVALKAKYSDKAKLIDLTSFDSSINPQANPLKYNLWYDQSRQLIGTRDFYERDYKVKYLLWQEGQEEPEEHAYDTKKDAKAAIKDRLQYFETLRSGAAQHGMPLNAPAPNFEIIPIDYPIVNKTVVMLNGVLQEETELKLCEFPLVLYFAYFNDGDYWTAMERLKDPQMFFNRMLMQADYWLGTMAKGLLRIDPQMPKNKRDEIVTNWGKTGGAVTAKSGQLELIQGAGPAPQIFTMAETAAGVMEDAFGGNNFLGMKETASESGVAVHARQAQAGMDNFVILDNMRRTKQKLGELIAWNLTNEITVERELRIVSDPMQVQNLVQKGILTPHPTRPNVGYVRINTNQDNSLEGLECDVVVGEAQYSPTQKQATLAAMTDAFKSGMIPTPPPASVILSLLPIPDEAKMAWQQEMSQQKPQVKTGLNINFKDLPPGAQNQVEEGVLGLKPDPQENKVLRAADVVNKMHPPTKPEPTNGKSQK